MLSNLNTTWNDSILQDFIANAYPGLNLPAGTVFNTYEEARDALIRAVENATLWQGYINGVAAPTADGQILNRIHNDGEDFPTIGYGMNLARPDINAGDYDDIFTELYGSLTADRQTAVDLLEAWRGNTAVSIVDDMGTADPSDDVTFSVTLESFDIINGAQLDNTAPSGGGQSPLETALAARHTSLSQSQIGLLAGELEKKKAAAKAESDASVFDMAVSEAAAQALRSAIGDDIENADARQRKRRARSHADNADLHRQSDQSAPSYPAAPQNDPTRITSIDGYYLVVPSLAKQHDGTQ